MTRLGASVSLGWLMSTKPVVFQFLRTGFQHNDLWCGCVVVLVVVGFLSAMWLTAAKAQSLSLSEYGNSSAAAEDEGQSTLMDCTKYLLQ